MGSPALRCAVLIAGSPIDDTGDSPLSHKYPMHLTPLLGKNPLLYAVETLVACGVQRIICLGWDEPVSCQTQLGDGRRRGCQLEWHSLSGPHQAFERLAQVAPPQEPFLLANTAYLMLPDLQEAGLEPGTLFVPQPQPSQDLSHPQAWGWAWIDRQQAQRLAHRARWSEWRPAMTAVCHRQQAVPGLSLMDGEALLAAIRPMLTRAFPAVIDASEIEPGVFMSRDVVIHPTARITAPVYVGADVEIGRNCRIGPGVAVGKRSHIGADTEITHAQLGADCWLGSSLDIHRAMVWRGEVWSETHQARLSIVDAGLLSHGSPWHWRPALVRQLGRLLALVLWLLLLPLVWFIMLMHLLGLSGNDRLDLVMPANRTPLTSPYTRWLGAHPRTRGWRHALGFVLPNLGGVILGRWYLVGLRPRTPAQWERLPPEHQSWMAGRACGLIQEEWLVDTDAEDVLQSMVIESYQEMRSTELLYPWSLLWRYLVQVLRTSRPQRSQNTKGKPSWI